jgi:hypothetical protein
MPFVIDICCHNKWTNTVYEYHIIDQYFLEKKSENNNKLHDLSIIEVVTLKEKLFFQIKILFMFYIN